MPKEEKTDLLNALSVFPADVQGEALWLRDMVWDQYPQANELIYDNYNAVAFGWSPTEKVSHTFCSIAVGRSSHNVHFGFYWGAEIADPEGLLIGNGNQYRYCLVKNITDLPLDYLKVLMKEAWQNSLRKVKNTKEIVTGKTIFKSTSPTKRKGKSKS